MNFQKRKRENTFDFNDDDDTVLQPKSKKFVCETERLKENSTDFLTGSEVQNCSTFSSSSKEQVLICDDIKDELIPDSCSKSSEHLQSVHVCNNVAKTPTINQSHKHNEKATVYTLASSALVDVDTDLENFKCLKESEGVHTENEKKNPDEQSENVCLPDCGVIYIHSQTLLDHCNRLPRIPGRSEMVHSLIEALGLLKYLKVVSPRPAEEAQIKQFHSSDYIEFLQHINHLTDEEKIDTTEAAHYGINYDCPVQEGLYSCAALVAGATIVAAQALVGGHCRIAVNWYGGWHHAQRSEASGFCYINDIVLGILKLREKFSRILYVDIDLHHGDGVENAFSTTPHVMTVSFHKYDSVFFPGTGDLNEAGSGKAKYYSVNVPLQNGLDDTHFFHIFKRVMTSVQEAYGPEVVVLQCGADGLAGDPMLSFNLTEASYCQCLDFLLQWKLPLLLLGGGGYDHANTARCWAFLTGVVAGQRLPEDVPDHKHFPEYGPGYELKVQAGYRKNENTLETLASIQETIQENLKMIKGKQF